MAGFLNKKKRLIDYKLTEHGRSQLSTGDIRFKYYTFSDRSIVYKEDKDSDLDNRISNSEFYYLPTEVTTDPGLYYNPEFYLNDEISTFSPENHIIFNFNQNETQKTLAENFSNSLYISTKKLSNKNIENQSDLVIDKLHVPRNFDFLNQTSSRKYPTVYFFKENIDNLLTVEKDYRFAEYLKFKRLDPINSSGTFLSEESSSTSEKDLAPKNPINYIFKTLDFKNEIFIDDKREEVISKVINLLSKNKEKMFYLDYELNESYAKENDIFVFEMNKIKNNKLDKLPFINLGKIFDKFNKRYISVFLIGKFIKKEARSESINIENSTTIIDISNDYYFVNLFTLVVE